MKNFKSMVYPYIIWSVIMVVLPMLMIVMYAFTKESNSVMNIRFTLDNFAYFFEDKVFIDVLKRSLVIAVSTTLICILIGYPTAYIMAKLKPKSQMIMVLMITLPTWINMLVRTYAWRGILDKNGLINSLLAVFGISPVKLLETTFAVVLGMVYNFLPFMILPIHTILSKMDQDLINAAKDLGANNFQVFTKVIFPLSLPGVISGITMVFMPAVSTFVISKLLGGGQFYLIGNLIEQEFMSVGDWHFGSAISIFMMIIILISMAIMNKYSSGTDKEGGGLLL